MKPYIRLATQCALVLFSTVFSAAATHASSDVDESQNPLAKGFIGRRHIRGGMLMYLRAANSDSLQRATFLSDQAAFRAIAEECGFIPKGARIYSRSTQPQPVDYHFVSASFAEVDLDDCERAKKSKNDLVLRKKLESEVTAKDQKLYDEYMRSEILRKSAPETVQPAAVRKREIVSHLPKAHYSDDDDRYLDGPQLDPKSLEDIDEIKLDEE